MVERILKHIIHYCRKTTSLIVAVVMLAMIGSGPANAESTVVLIAAKGSGIESISNRDIRRVYLGLKSSDSEIVNKPVINIYNKDVYEAFLKNVMHMTEGAYKRKLVKRIFRNGSQEIKEIDTLDELNAHLIKNVGDISFVEGDIAEKMHDVEVVKVLW